MRRLIKVLGVAAAAALVFAPTPARAEGYVSPWAGVNFANNSGDGHANFGVDAGGMGAGIIGGEFDFGYSPNFFGSSGSFGSNYVMDAMGNLIVGVPVGGTRGAGIRPYVTVGTGLLRSQMTGGVNGLAEVANNSWGLNAGFGAMGFLSDHVGLRGDVRYFRDLTGNADNLNNIDFGAFHFWRASFGVVLR